MSWTVGELEQRINQEITDAEGNNDAVWYDGWDAIEYLDSYGDNPNDTIDLEGFGTIEFVDHFGGEGQGDDYWTVFRIGDRYFRMDGWYSSYEGHEYDGELDEVYPKEVTRTEYFTQKELEEK